MQKWIRNVLLSVCLFSSIAHAYEVIVPEFTLEEECDPCCVPEGPSYTPITRVDRTPSIGKPIPYTRHDCCYPEPLITKIILGADVIITQKFKGDRDWNRIFPSNYLGGSVYVGTRFYTYFGLEVGYDFLPRKTRNIYLTGLTPFFGQTIPDTVLVKTQISVREWRADLNGYLPLDEGGPDLIASVGFGRFKPIVSVTLTPNNDLFDSAISSIKINPKYVWRAGLGLQYVITETLGLRALVRWQGISKFTVIGNPNYTALFSNGTTNNAFKKTATFINVGFFTLF